MVDFSHLSVAVLYLDNTPLWITLVISLVFSVVVAIVVQFFLVPRLKRQILEDMTQIPAQGGVNFTCGDTGNKFSRSTKLRVEECQIKKSENVKYSPTLVTDDENNTPSRHFLTNVQGSSALTQREFHNILCQHYLGSGRKIVTECCC